jgi:hypothetical protein
MIAQIALISNWKEIDYASTKICVDPPEEVYEYHPFGFHLDDVKMFHRDLPTNQIVLFFEGNSKAIKYNDEIYQTLITRFEND